MMKVFSLLSLCFVVISCQDDGQYVHNPDWDLTPIQLFRLRKGLAKQQAPANSIAEPTVAVVDVSPAVAQAVNIPAAAAVRRVAAVRRPTVQQQQQFQNFPASAAVLPASTLQFQPESAVPVVRQQLQAIPVVRQQVAAAAPAAVQQQQPAVLTAEFIQAATRHPDPNFWNRAWAYQAPTYTAQAQGSSYTYNAIF